MSTRRPYASPLREKAAAQTRESILLAAADLFGSRGYGLVTIADIASAAGVSPKTVFASVGSKREIMDRVVDRGIDESRYEQAMQRLLNLHDPYEIIEALSAGTRLGNQSQLAVHEAIRMALPVHEDGAALWERATRDYRAAMHAAAQHLHTLTPPPRYPAKETADLLWSWFGPAGWRALVVEGGWTWDRAEAVLRENAFAGLYNPVHHQ
ncbi:TetR/AcrR family transcriptional regulator [Actinospica robiniae]|uniref:TetR/AcrR family transcriptional regulator n=1 Tax=Actinospica robiniae TaxID=304901 RepID=UPI0004277CF8|nr:TetR/AcrR family transcriptional regulator [Actinospica robiniae]